MIRAKGIGEPQRMTAHIDPGSIQRLNLGRMFEDHPELASVELSFAIVQLETGETGDVRNIDVDRHDRHCKVLSHLPGRQPVTV